MEEFDDVSDNTIAALIPVTTMKRYVKKALWRVEKEEGNGGFGFETKGAYAATMETCG